MCEVWMVSRNRLKIDLATWCPISKDWDINIDIFYFTAVTCTE